MDTEMKLSKCLERAVGKIDEMKVLWDIDFPLLLSIKSNGRHWVAYVTEFSRRRQQVELVLSLSDNQAIKEMSAGQKPIREVMTERPYWMMRWKLDLNAGTCKPDLVLNEVVEELLPGADFVLSAMIPNRIDLQE